MDRRSLLLALGFALWSSHVSIVHAQAKIPRIGFLSQCTSSFDQEPFERALRDLGYVEGKNISVAWRRFPNDVEQLRRAAADFVSSKVDVIVTCATVATRAAFDATKDIPIVFAGNADPIGSGVAQSLAKPGANATGVSVLVPELYPKERLNKSPAAWS